MGARHGDTWRARSSGEAGLPAWILPGFSGSGNSRLECLKKRKFLDQHAIFNIRTTFGVMVVLPLCSTPSFAHKQWGHFAKLVFGDTRKLASIPPFYSSLSLLSLEAHKFGQNFGRIRMIRSAVPEQQSREHRKRMDGVASNLVLRGTIPCLNTCSEYIFNTSRRQAGPFAPYLGPHLLFPVSLHRLSHHAGCPYGGGLCIDGSSWCIRSAAAKARNGAEQLDLLKRTSKVRNRASAYFKS